MAACAWRILLVGLACLALAGIATAQSVEGFYRDRAVSMLVSFGPGGLNDIAGRLVAQHLRRFIPGQPNIIVQNMPGAGGLAAANHLYNIAARDGSVVGQLDRSVAQSGFRGTKNARFDPTKFTWLGSLSSYANDAYMMLVNASHPAKTAADLHRPDVLVALGGDNAASSNLIFALIAREALGLNVKLVRGYTGAAPMFYAMQAGELDGQMIGLSSVKTGQRDLWERHVFRPLLQFGRTTRLKELAELPTGRELARDANALALIEFAELPFFMALPFAAPPDIPGDRAAALQSAFMAMCRDPAFLEEAERLGFDVSPIDATQVQSLLARSAATPQDVIARYTALGGQ
jgi:tripartite-type tricarboxylate transporter receptor subunit TctC